MSSRKQSDYDVVDQIVAEGLLQFGLPSMFLFVGATYFMRRRVARFAALPAEHFILTGLQYYGAATLGVALGMKIYGPILERKILERIPNSELAQKMRAERRP